MLHKSSLYQITFLEYFLYDCETYIELQWLVGIWEPARNTLLKRLQRKYVIAENQNILIKLKKSAVLKGVNCWHRGVVSGSGTDWWRWQAVARLSSSPPTTLRRLSSLMRSVWLLTYTVLCNSYLKNNLHPHSCPKPLTRASTIDVYYERHDRVVRATIF